MCRVDCVLTSKNWIKFLLKHLTYKTMRKGEVPLKATPYVVFMGNSWRRKSTLAEKLADVSGQSSDSGKKLFEVIEIVLV